MTKLTETLSKKQAANLAEEIDATGQDSEEKAVKWIKEVEERNRKQEEKIDADEQEILFNKRKYKKNGYYEALKQMAHRRLQEHDIPQGYTVIVYLTDAGKLIFGLQKEGYRWYAKGMNICGEPKYDINCVERLVIQTILSLDELVAQHEQRKTQSGILLPTKK